MDTPKESASSPTGRLPSEPEMQFLKPPELPTCIREIMDFLANDAATITGIDFAQKPGSMGAMLVRYVDGKMEVKHLTGIQGRKADLVILDDLVSDGSTIVEDIEIANERLMAIDFSDLEMRALVHLSQAQLHPLILGGRGHAKTETIKRFRHGFFEVDFDPEELRREERRKRGPQKPKKNLSYLALDPTKSHRKRRR